MTTNHQAAGAALFDVEILRRHVDAGWLKARIGETLDALNAGAHSIGRHLTLSTAEVGTDRALLRAIIHLGQGTDLTEKVRGILFDLQAEGVLQAIPHGADRDLPQVLAWNKLVDQGRAGITKVDAQALDRTPLVAVAVGTLCTGGLEAIRKAREAAGIVAFPERSSGFEPRYLPCDEDLVEAVISASMLRLEEWVGGARPGFMMTNTIKCGKTDEMLSWADDRLLDPVLGVWRDLGPDPDTGRPRPSSFEPIGAFTPAKPLRHLEVTVPSGVLLMADWFRIPGFNEGVNYDWSSYPSIGSDRGVDARTQDHYERLGLLRIHTTNCVPGVHRDGDLFRVGSLNEDHEDLWIPDATAEYGERFRSELVPEEIGRVCCDLWDVTFADREILADILVAGGERIAANGGIGENGREVLGAPRTREEALALLDAYEKANTVTRITLEEGSKLHLYMATGSEVEEFQARFCSPDVTRHEWLDDMFILSSRPLDVPDALLEDADWVWPERYAEPQRNLEP